MDYDELVQKNIAGEISDLREQKSIPINHGYSK